MQVQAEFDEHHSCVVLPDCGTHLLFVSTSDCESGCECAGEVKMKRKPIIYGLVTVVIAIVLLLVSYLYLGSAAPTGQQALVRLNASNIESLKQSFNESKDSVRVIVMLSPT